METVACPLGCPAGDHVVITAGDRLHGRPGRWSVVQCRSCGLRRTSPRPTAADIGAFYPDADYRPFQLRERAHGWRDWFHFSDRSVPDMEAGRMLEIGAATGHFMVEMRERGWLVHGIEPSRHAAHAAQALGLDVHVGQVETAPAPTNPYDLVVGWMVLEHLHEPVGALRRIHSWTRSGARLVLSVPDNASLEARVFKDMWYALQLPTHLFHYTPDTIAKVLAAGGWQVERVMYQRVLTNAMVSFGWCVAARWPARGVGRWLIDFPLKGRWHYALFPLSAAMAALGQTGRITVWATRI